MRTPALLTAVLATAIVGLCGIAANDVFQLEITLANAKTHKTLAGLIQIEDETGKPVVVRELMNRGLGVDGDLPIHDWYVVPPKTVTIELPAGRKLKIRAISGLEFQESVAKVDLSEGSTAKVTIDLVPFYDSRAKGQRSANTHLHLQKIDRETCDTYLRDVPRADGLDAVFVSYLERAVADREYTSNRYSADDLQKLADASRVRFGNGEEHRHNFTGFGQGYGHVMLLNIKQLVLPVSIGPGIMKTGTDGIPLRRGIAQARRDDATVVWCHNEWGMESVPNWVTGQIDAQNIFDGSIRSSYEDSFYRYLNAGLKVPFSTGTDWFQYDFSRVYVDMEGPDDIPSWLRGLKAGRSYITNGPLLDFSVDDANLGDTLDRRTGDTVTIRGSARGRVDFEVLQLIRNGEVVSETRTKAAEGHVIAEFSHTMKIAEPCWLALRTPPPSVAERPNRYPKRPLNALGREIFSHTSPIYVNVNGRGVFQRAVAEGMLAELETHRATIAERGRFADDQEKARVLDVYQDATIRLKERLEGK